MMTRDTTSFCCHSFALAALLFSSLLCNTDRQGKTQLAKYYVPPEESEKHKVQYEVHRLLVNRDPKFTNFVKTQFLGVIAPRGRCIMYEEGAKEVALSVVSGINSQRQIGETSLNETSSRSHQILRLNFVHLAGSERASQSLSAGSRLKEGCHINRSLLTLGTLIRKLSFLEGGYLLKFLIIDDAWQETLNEFQKEGQPIFDIVVPNTIA
ncbi:hypothetical protein L1049_009703 [Liquidambar formosana]|uniref:Kinesin motor domain-containing protein n=1 Tax=Liquidambar formosana TaxID=63359 RepID=A0AAP0N692_LIQFO